MKGLGYFFVFEMDHAYTMHYTYVLRSLKDRELYVGSTADLQRRFTEHQSGRAEATAPRRPFELLFYEAFKCKADAERRERYLKSTKGRRSLRQILQESLAR